MAPIAAPVEQRQQIAALLAHIRSTGRHHEGAAPYKLVSPSGEETELPESVYRLLQQVTEVLARGDAISIVPVGKELTTQQAANILNVSRQYLVRLLDDGRLPFRKTGSHRRVRMEDVVAYKRARDQERVASLDELAQLTQDYGGYDELSEDDG